jgi:ribonuclease-3
LYKFVRSRNGCYTQINMNKRIDLYDFKKKIGIEFKDTALLERVFVHSSYSHENHEYININNERLEFLGDSVLNFVISAKIFEDFPDLPEGKLTEIRVSLIREETLARIASTLDLGKYLCLGKGEEATGGRKRQTNLADTLEALIGALFLDQGLSKTRSLILKLFNEHLELIKDGSIAINYKSRLQEFTQAKYSILPQYTLTEETGPDHDKNFIVQALLGDRVLGTGSGKSKKAAEMEAARLACDELGIP